MLTNALILIAVVLTGIVLMLPRVAGSQAWRATITPLASIIGSGFLILGPLLTASYGGWAPVVMLLLCAVAYAFGSAIRFNIHRIDSADQRSPMAERIDALSGWVLAFAYIISVAYYLNLFGAFGVSLTSVDDPTHARMLTTAIFGIILFVGWTWGFSALERMEQISVGVKLAIIAGLLTGLMVSFAGKVGQGSLIWNPPGTNGWAALTLAFGLIVTVQGFETSRYLGATYDADRRVRSMRAAQWLSTLIYMIYICLIAYLFLPDQLETSETAIIDLMGIVAPILPPLLVAAALSAQFSAAVADTGGSGGLLVERSGGRITARQGYLALVVVGVAMTWALDVFQIIAYASRAFALYYALQAGLAALSAHRQTQIPRAAFFAGLALLGLTIAVFGRSVE